MRVPFLVQFASVVAALTLPLHAGCSSDVPASPRCDGPDTAAAVRVSRHFDGSFYGIRALEALPDGTYLAAGALGDERPPASQAPPTSGGSPTIVHIDAEGAVLGRRELDDVAGVVHSLSRDDGGAVFLAGSTSDASITLKNVLENEPAGMFYFPKLGFAARVDPETFEPLWDFGFAGEFDELFAVAGSPAGVVVGGQTENPSDRKPDAYLAGLDHETGAKLWELRIVFDKQGQVVGLGVLPSGDVVAAIEAWGNVLEGVSAPLPAGDGVHSLLLALDPATGSERWAKILGDGSDAGSQLSPHALAVAADGSLALGGNANEELDLGLGDVPSGGSPFASTRREARWSCIRSRPGGPSDVSAVAFDANGGGGILAAGDFTVSSSSETSLRIDGAIIEPSVRGTSDAAFVAGFSPAGAFGFGHVLPAVDNVQPGDSGVLEATAVASGPGRSVMLGAWLSGIANLAACSERSSENGDAVLLRVDP